MPADASPSFLIAPAIPSAGEIVELPPDERRHLFRVCRARDGETATVTDGAGRIARVTVEGRGVAARVRVEHVRVVPRGARACIDCRTAYSSLCASRTGISASKIPRARMAGRAASLTACLTS